MSLVINYRQSLVVQLNTIFLKQIVCIVVLTPISILDILFILVRFRTFFIILTDIIIIVSMTCSKSMWHILYYL